MSLENIQNLFSSYPSLYHATQLLGIIWLGAVVYVLCHRYFYRWIRLQVRSSKNKYDDILYEQKVIRAAMRLIPALVVYFGIVNIKALEPYLGPVIRCYLVMHVTVLLDRLIDAGLVIYETFPISLKKPIKGYAQLLKIFLYLLGIIVALALLMGESPWYFLSGIGAITAVLMFVFRDTILSVVASIQIISNDLIRVGDWISAEQFQVDGDVIEIALHTVKIQNWDKTISMVPTYKLVDSHFKNWRGMSDAGGRRIKRAIMIDQNSVRFCDTTMLERFKGINILNSYLSKKEAEYYRQNPNTEDAINPLNGQKLTNLGIFRYYLEQYVKQQHYFRDDMTFLVRQLKPGPEGIPMEIYFFSKNTEWAVYEKIQADLFDFILAAIPEFELRIFQNPTGFDLYRVSSRQQPKVNYL